jgi:hypothetical protein
MTRRPRDPAALLRGAAAGLLTAALAAAAHGLASGVPPTGAVAVQLALLSATVGALAATLTRGHDARILTALLAAGQLAGHLVLGAAHHHATTTAPPGAVMLAAHALAVVLGATLIAASSRLCSTMARAVRAVARPLPSAPPAPSGCPAMPVDDQPLRFMLLLAASMSHRGPPVSAHR